MKPFSQLFRTFHADRYVALGASMFFLVSSALSQNSVEMDQAILDLSNDGVIMNISAHPDDEDGASLAYYRMKYGVKTYSILFTRGEGGQNEIGPELYEELGVLRTAETKEAGKIIGAEVHFLNFKDFGFSKTATETFEKWGGQSEPLRRLVYVIRKYKPDIIFTNHNTVEGHGHHQVVAITAIAAFDAAADSTMFPEQLKLPGITTWQPRKLFFRNFARTELTSDVVNQIDERNPLRKMSYLDIAADALQQHKTQGMDRADLRRFTRGLSLYRLMRANSMYDRDTTTFFGGIHLWDDPLLALLRSMRDDLFRIHRSMSQDSLFTIASTELMHIENMGMPSSPVAARILHHWKEDLQHLVQLSCNVSATWTFVDSVVVPTQKVKSIIRLKSDKCTLSNPEFRFDVPQGWAVNRLGTGLFPLSGKNVSAEYEVFIGEGSTLSLPKTVALYNPLESEQEIALQANFSLDGKPVSISVRPHIEIAPQQTLSISPAVTRISPSGASQGRKFSFRLKNYAPRKTAGRISVQAPPGWSAESASFIIAHEDSTATGTITVRPPSGVKPGEYKIVFKSGFAVAEATVKVFQLEIDKNVRLGIIKSYDTTLESAADELGVPYKLLSAKDLEGDLSPYTTIVIDIRAYLVRNDLKKNNKHLLDYVHNGGNLVVMYQKDQEWNPEFAPYPFRVGRKRVTKEDAAIDILEPNHPLFNTPNKISPEDWNGWIQELGVYFPEDPAPEYVKLLSSHDPDEQPLTNGYLLAQYGRGSYIYTSYVWYRQMKEYNPGALRNFINMISYPTHRAKP